MKLNMMTVQKTKFIYIYMTIKTMQNTQVMSRFHLSILHLQQNNNNSYLMNHLVKWRSYVIWHLLNSYITQIYWKPIWNPYL